MRIDERAVRDILQIQDILQRCDTVRIGLNGGEFPYVVPMTFGSAVEDGKIAVYIHSAGEGRKGDILAKDPRVCVEADLYYKVAKKDNGEITAVYESVIGTGVAERLTAQADKVAALKIMLAHYKESGFPVTSCHGLGRVECFRIVLDEVSGKRNL